MAYTIRNLADDIIHNNIRNIPAEWRTIADDIIHNRLWEVPTSRTFNRDEFLNELLHNYISEISPDPVNPPGPTITSLDPNNIEVNSPAFPLTVNGTNFVDNSVVKWGGSSRDTLYVGSTQLIAEILETDVADPETVAVTVFTPTPGGGTSNAQTFTINEPIPYILSLTPNSAEVGDDAFTLEVSGTLFDQDTVVRWEGSDRDTTFVSYTSLTAEISASDIADGGEFDVTVFNPSPSGGLSNPEVFTVNNPVPTLIGMSPSSRIAGSVAFTLTISGTNFENNSTVQLDGSDRDTTFVSGASLTAEISASDITDEGTVNVTVFNPAPGGGESDALTFTVNNPAPALSNISPSGAIEGGISFTLTVCGSNFVDDSVVKWASVSKTTTYVSPTELTAAIPDTNIALANNYAVTVFNSSPGGGTSGSLIFEVDHPLPELDSITPSTTGASGSSFTLTANGTNFVNNSVVKWGGSNRTTTYVSSIKLTASILEADVADPGTVAVTVFTPTPGGGTSNDQTFTIT
jgi:hypothetical protein